MLSGYLVVDCTDALGWTAGRILAELGADVLRIEAPNSNTSGNTVEWQAANINKRSLTLDLGTGPGRAELVKLLAKADILLETAAPGSTAAAAMDEDCANSGNAGLIHVAITPFGRTGPRAGWLGGDLEIMAGGGAMTLAGEPDGQPVRVSVPQSQGWAGAMAAVGALTALNHRAETGEGQLVDVSAQASVVAALAHAPAFWDIERTLPKRAGAFMTGRSIHGASYRVFWPCKDGYLNFILYGGIAGRRTNEALVSWMGEAGAELGVLAGIDWATFDPTQATQEEIDNFEAPISRFFLTVTKREFLNGAFAREMLGYPVSTVQDISTDPQLDARGFWQDIPGPDGKLQRHCGGFAIVDGERLKVQRPDDGAGERTPRATSRRRNVPPLNPPRQALEGINVAVFGGYAAGPWIGKVLANFGASVVHVESKDRPDGFRMQYPPYKDGKKGVNRGGCFSYFNDSKHGITLDIKKPGGAELGRRLLDWCDVVVENMRPGVMARIGLGYEEAIKTNPGLIMISTCNMGQTGPRASAPGFGSQLSALAGFCGLTGERDGSPMLLYGPYIDFIAALYGASAALAALDRRRATGKGAWIDISQYECGIDFISGAMLDFHTTGRIAERAGNDDPLAAPHGAYPCRGDDAWLALSCGSDEEFARLAAAAEHPEWAGDARFAGAAARRANKAELDGLISGWTASREANAAAEILQQAQVHSYPVNSIADLFTDPQLAHRKTWRKQHHQVIGDQSYYFPGFDLSATPGAVTKAAPLLGGENEIVYREFLGLSEEEYQAYQSQGVIG